ncbi:MAG: aminomethyl transferase family protein [Clostridiaceae bacterium]
MFSIDSPLVKDAALIAKMGPIYIPYVVTTNKEELLACRTTAWLGQTLNTSPIYDISGPDCVKLLNYTTVNRDYSTLKIGKSRHVIFCNEKGQMLADGVLFRISEDTYRSYWLAPVLSYYVETLGFDVKGEWVRDEFFFQVDGPKSLEIMEKASKTDLHDLKFAQNKEIELLGVPCIIHRLGMSGTLAYELHGPMKDAEKIYEYINNVGQEFGIKRLGQSSYPRNHTPGGYPNQFIHYWYPYLTSGEKMKEYFENQPYTKHLSGRYPFFGSASFDKENAFLTPYDVDWGYLVNFDHDFVGKDALLKLSNDPPRKVVTLEWDADDVGKVFASQFKGKNVEPLDDIDRVGDGGEAKFIISNVVSDGKIIGMASGRTKYYYENKMLSLAFIDKKYAVEGKELEVIWGTDPNNQMPIKVTVAKFPYYNEELRNETFDVEKIPHPVF